MSRNTVMTFVALALAAITFQVGCSRPEPLPPVSVKPEFRKPPVVASEEASPFPALASIEKMTFPPTDRSLWPKGLKELPAPAKGDRIMWVRKTLTNSGDATGAIVLGNNYPVLTDAAGRMRPLLYPPLSVPKATPIGPGGTIVLIMLYDVPAERQTYTMKWTLHGAGLEEAGESGSFVWP